MLNQSAIKIQQEIYQSRWYGSNLDAQKSTANGSYLAVSNVGQERQSNPNADLGAGRIYFNFTASGAIALMENLTLQLNAASIPFSFQVLHNPSAYGRYDSGLLYFELPDYPAIRTILQAIYPENQSHFQPVILGLKTL